MLQSEVCCGEGILDNVQACVKRQVGVIVRRAPRFLKCGLPDRTQHPSSVRRGSTKQSRTVEAGAETPPYLGVVAKLVVFCVGC